jgi:phosphopantothenoylcysteine decarboxylase / phosphopantothenate---cysteine ligase
VRILLGVSGGIAAYKAAELVRLLKADGHEVRCALTRSARAFVTPLTLEVLTGAPVYQEEYLTASGSGEEEHIAAARWADLLCVAPATAHALARLALGLADDFLTTTALAFAGTVVVAPAMHAVMWEKETVAGHVAALVRRGVKVVGPVAGPLASGEVGMGRMAEPAEIAAAIREEGARRGTGALAGRRVPGRPLDGRRVPSRPLAGRRVVVTAGPTHEPIDPVRFLGNRSSGRMGFALAAEAARRGAEVTLIAGPVSLPTPATPASTGKLTRIDVETAAEMAAAVGREAPAADLVIMAAAVADFRPRRKAPAKIKKEEGVPGLDLEPTSDILAGLPTLAPRAVLVGFAAETADLAANARAKLARKGVDFLVANDVSRGDIAFGSDANEVTVFSREGEPVFLSRRPKAELAADLLDLFTGALAPPEALR